MSPNVVDSWKRPERNDDSAKNTDQSMVVVFCSERGEMLASADKMSGDDDIRGVLGGDRVLTEEVMRNRRLCSIRAGSHRACSGGMRNRLCGVVTSNRPVTA